jgi:hypothetical protein
VIIEDIDEKRDAKIALLQKAATDPLFISDIIEITSDFEPSDIELI